MWRVYALVMVVVASSACFDPEPAAGAPCGPGDVCPTGLSCIGGVCTSGDGSGSSGECIGEIDGVACGSATMSDCSVADTCAAELCATNDLPNGTGCYDCAAGAASCASCAQGACRDSTCQPSGMPSLASLTSPLDGSNGDEGSMFDVVAMQAITITSFDGHLGATGNTDYEIWTRPGTYVGFEGSSSGWTKVGMATFGAAGTGAFTAIPIPINITLQPGQRQAFYLTNHASNNKYHDGSQVGATLVANAELTIYQGAGVNFGTNGFAGTNTPRAWEGRIHYRGGGGTTLATPMAGAASSDGVMFDVKPMRNLELSLLAVNLGAGTHDVDVYFHRGTRVGSESTPAQWRKLVTIMNVVSSGPGTATPLPMPLGLFVEAGATTALYITTTTSPAVRTQSVSGPNAATNADVTIEHGVAISGSFGGSAGNATPNIELGYGTCN
jgi:hypothetical protein